MPMAIHMTSRMRIAHGVPYVAMETTEEAVPTITSPMMQSSATHQQDRGERQLTTGDAHPGRRRPGVPVVAGATVLDRGGP